MFTGLVEGIGEIEALKPGGGETRLSVRPRFKMEHVALGESIAVNGVCLTVESFASGVFTAYASAETLSRSNLGQLRRGSPVNLERALRLQDRLGGHIVSGHVDCLARVAAIGRAGASTLFRLDFPPEYAAQVIPKGSVALDGVSLTINECSERDLSVNIIPATIEATAIKHWRAGSLVNMETDVLGKYVLRALALGQAGPERAGQTPDRNTPGRNAPEQEEGKISLEFLRENGF